MKLRVFGCMKLELYYRKRLFRIDIFFQVILNLNKYLRSLDLMQCPLWSLPSGCKPFHGRNNNIISRVCMFCSVSCTCHGDNRIVA